MKNEMSGGNDKQWKTQYVNTRLCQIHYNCASSCVSDSVHLSI